MNLDKLRNLIKLSEKRVQQDLKKWDLKLDSANFQTRSKEDFKKFTEKFENNGFIFVHQLKHAGRQINIYKLPTNVKLPIKYIEVSEPKPGRTLSKNIWEYVSYIIDNYDNFVDDEQIRGNLEKVRRINQDKFCYINYQNVTIQFRNKSVAKSLNANISAQTKKKKTNKQESLENTIKELKTSLNKEKEAKLKLMADFENFRKIKERELERNIQLAEKNIIKDIIEVLDAFEQALKTSKDKGTQELYNKLLNIINNYGYFKINIKQNDDFNPETMEAISSIESEDKEKKNKIADIIMSGYIHKSTNQIIRTAKVVVWK